MIHDVASETLHVSSLPQLMTVTNAVVFKSFVARTLTTTAAILRVTGFSEAKVQTAMGLLVLSDIPIDGEVCI